MAEIGPQLWLEAGLQSPNHTEVAAETSVIPAVFPTNVVALSA